MDQFSPEYFDDIIKRGFGQSAGVQAPASTLDAATQARLAAARAADTASVTTAQTHALAPEAGPAAAPKAGGFGARAATALNPNMGTLLKGAKGLGKASLALAPVIGAIDAATDSKDQVRDFGASVGMDTASAGGRIGANVLNFLNKTGNAATFGVAGRVGRVLAGGSFFDDASASPAASAPAAAPASVVAAAPAVAEAPAAEQEQQMDPLTSAAMAALNYRPMPAAGGAQSGTTSVQPYGGGYIQREGGERVELPSGTTTTTRTARPSLANYIDTQVERNAAREDQRVKLEGVKAATGLIGAGKRGADELLARGKIAAATEYLRQNPGDLDGYVALLSGKPSKEVVGTVTSPTGSTSVVERRAGGQHKAITVDEKGNMVEKPIYRTPSGDEVDLMRKNKASAAHKDSFARHFGPDAYKTYIEK